MDEPYPPISADALLILLCNKLEYFSHERLEEKRGVSPQTCMELESLMYRLLGRLTEYQQPVETSDEETTRSLT
jgi:hypothetical protein